MNGEMGAVGKETEPSDSAPGQGNPRRGRACPPHGLPRSGARKECVSFFRLSGAPGKAAVFASDEFFFGTPKQHLSALRHFFDIVDAPRHHSESRTLGVTCPVLS